MAERLLARARQWASRRVVILQDATDDDLNIREVSEEIASLLEAWRSLKLRIEFMSWEAANVKDISSAQAVLPLLTWNYAESPKAAGAFCKLLRAACESGGQPNADLCGTAWVVHKRYLEELRAEGVPIVPTVLLPAGTTTMASLDDALIHMREAGGPDGFVAKPAIGGGGDGVERVADDGDAAATVLRLLRARGGDMLLQPFLSRVRRAGELAFVFVNGTLLHAIKKEPCGWAASAAQPVSRLDTPPAEAERCARLALEVARARCGARPSSQLYLARVDLLPDQLPVSVAGCTSHEDCGVPMAEERWLVSEVELGWPHLFLRADPSGQAIATAAEGLLRHLHGETAREEEVAEESAISKTKRRRRVGGAEAVASVV